MGAQHKARRGRGEGSLRFNETTGLWTGVHSEMVDGKRKQHFVRSRDKAVALEKLRAVQAGGVVRKPDHETTGHWLTTWLDDVLPGTVAASSEGQYRQAVKDWVTPSVGHIPLAKLAPEDVVRMMRDLEARGLSATTQAMARKILRRALRKAEQFGKVTRNVAALVDPPKAAPPKLDDSLDLAETRRVLEAAKTDRLGALAVFVFFTGARQGEALRLRWDDVDLDAGMAIIRGTKTEASHHKVPLAPDVVAALRVHRKGQAEERLAATYWGDPDLVFASPIGSSLDRWRARDWWNGLLDDAGVERRRFHASRHTAATLMLNNGVALELVSKMLGHAGYAITSDIYAKVRPELQRTAADAMQRALGAK